MLVLKFNIGCKEDHAMEVLGVLNEYGVQVTRETKVEEQVLSSEFETVVYFECMIPCNRYDWLLSEFEDEKYGTILIKY